jgi:hypothetical protein
MLVENYLESKDASEDYFNNKKMSKMFDKKNWIGR